MEDLPQQPSPVNNLPQPPRTMVSVIAVSLIFGLLGGYLGATYNLNHNPAANSAVSQKVALSEDSAVIDVVKKASPAVVSIVISKDLNKIPGYSLNPFNEDPFFNFF